MTHLRIVLLGNIGKPDYAFFSGTNFGEIVSLSQLTMLPNGDKLRYRGGQFTPPGEMFEALGLGPIWDWLRLHREGRYCDAL